MDDEKGEWLEAAADAAAENATLRAAAAPGESRDEEDPAEDGPWAQRLMRKIGRAADATKGAAVSAYGATADAAGRVADATADAARRAAAAPGEWRKGREEERAISEKELEEGEREEGRKVESSGWLGRAATLGLARAEETPGTDARFWDEGKSGVYRAQASKIAAQLDTYHKANPYAPVDASKVAAMHLADEHARMGDRGPGFFRGFNTSALSGVGYSAVMPETDVGGAWDAVRELTITSTASPQQLGVGVLLLSCLYLHGWSLGREECAEQCAQGPDRCDALSIVGSMVFAVLRAWVMAMLMLLVLFAVEVFVVGTIKRPITETLDDIAIQAAAGERPKMPTFSLRIMFSWLFDPRMLASIGASFAAAAAFAAIYTTWLNLRDAPPATPEDYRLCATTAYAFQLVAFAVFVIAQFFLKAWW